MHHLRKEQLKKNSRVKITNFQTSGNKILLINNLLFLVFVHQMIICKPMI